jgi:DNA-directed RNA polymerase beta subunit
VINGAQCIVVSQRHRSPGICFEDVVHASATPPRVEESVL